MKTRRAKIVGTIGPSCEDEATLRSLIQAGLNVARLNFSHGTHEDHAQIYQNIRRLSKELGQPITIMQDLQGPKIRTGEIQNGEVLLESGQKLNLTVKPLIGDANTVSVDFPELTEVVEKGGRILLDDGNLELLITAVQPDHVETQVVLGGVLKPHKGVNLPGARIRMPGLTEKDEDDLRFGLSLGIDIVAISFVSTAVDIEQVRQAIQTIAPNCRDIPIIAKLERPEAIDNLHEIVHAADGLMVARGDLGVEMSPEAVPIAQKKIIESANRHSKIVITATQMLDSMIHNPRPTRAEASDVANAIFDGTDAVMLSGETASGKYPVQAVEMMNAIACQAESNMAEWGHWQGNISTDTPQDDTFYLTKAARELAHDRNVAAIAVFTKSGRTALLMSKARPGVPILAFTPLETTFHRLNLYWGVVPRLVPHVENIDEMLRVVEQSMVETTSIKPGQQVVLICGYPVSDVRPTNLALLHTVGSKMGLPITSAT
jgi:pyruvate kinase